ncbi:hypothetical protein MNBD_GAMMA23-2059 [hydrothermal vent metagenome]|uniref:Flagellar protein FliL n=1 Tax=hydrothermal vent metagenome TaxID=652676 RepID=A0A3B1A5D8_9ZZZZ
MANKEKEKDLDLDVEQTGKSKTNLLIIVLIVVILAAGGGVAAVFLLGGDSEDEKAGTKGEEAAQVAPAHAIYSALRPTFIINFEDTKKARYVQLDLTVMAHEQHAIDLVQEHSPVIRNNIITILSGQKYEVLSTLEGKQKLRTDLLNSINQTITTEVSNSAPAEDKADDGHVAVPVAGQSYIKAVYFTSLVMQ